MPQTPLTPLASAAEPKLLHIFKPGTWTAMSGERIEFSAADLAATAAAFNPTLARAPLVIGHPATDDPAQGWAATLTANARGLFAMPHRVDPAFAEAVNAGRYGNVSAKFYRPTDASNPTPGVWYLRHIGFLGGTAPAVKGLDLPAFAGVESEGVCFQEGMAFAEYDDVTNASLWRRLRDWMIADKGLSVADEVIPAYQVQSLEQSAQDELREAAQEGDATPQFAEPQPKESTVTLEEKNALEAENTRLKHALQAQLRTQSHAAHLAFCEGLAGVMPAWRAVAVATLDHFSEQPEPVAFGEGEARQPLAEQFKAMLQSLPDAVAFGETATGTRAALGVSGAEFAAPHGYSVDPASLGLHNRAVAHQGSHGGSYMAAIAAVQAAV